MKIRGIEIALHHDEALSNHIRRERDFFEAEILDFLKDYYPRHRTILDIGANIGNHSVYFAEFLSYEYILCFEPISENFDLLRENMLRYNGVGLIQAAITAHTGTTLMQKVMHNMGASHISEEGIEVNCFPIDRLALTDVTLMKIDVEEHEPDVLEGASDTILRCKPLVLIEDWHDSYHDLLKDLDLEMYKPWPNHHTYLWGPRREPIFHSSRI